MRLAKLLYCSPPVSGSRNVDRFYYSSLLANWPAMDTVKTSDDHWRCFLTVDEFTQFVELADEKHGDDEPWVAFGILLMGLSLRIGTLTRIRACHFREGPAGIILLRVWEKNSSSGDARRQRDVWVPRPVYRRIERYMEENNISGDDKLFRRSQRTFERRFDSLCEELAERTEYDDWLKVTRHDMRRYYAVHFLYRLEIDPTLVRQMGGWMSEESMFEYLSLPEDVLYSELEGHGVIGADALFDPTSPDQVDSFNQSFKQLLYDSDAEARADIVRSLEDGIESLDGVSAEISINTGGLEDMDNPSAPVQRQINMFGASPPYAAALLVADQIRRRGPTSPPTEPTTNKLRGKIRALRDHPEFIDPTTPTGTAQFSIALLAPLLLMFVYPHITPFGATESIAIAVTGFAIGLHQINQELERFDRSSSVA